MAITLGSIYAVGVQPVYITVCGSVHEPEKESSAVIPWETAGDGKSHLTWCYSLNPKGEGGDCGHHPVSLISSPRKCWWLVCVLQDPMLFSLRGQLGTLLL